MEAEGIIFIPVWKIVKFLMGKGGDLKIVPSLGAGN